MIQQTEPTIKILSTALERIADNVMITNRQGIIEYVNPAFESTTGYSVQEAVGQTPKILRSGQHNAEYYHALWETILAGNVFRATTTNKKKNGDIYYADQTISPVHDEKGEILCFVSVWKDITERFKAEEKLKHLNEQLIFEKKKLEQVLSLEAGLHRILELHKLIDFVVEKICAVLEAEKCSVMFIDHESKELCIKGHQGIEESRIEGDLLKVGDHFEHLIKRYHKTETPSSTKETTALSIESQNNFSKIDGTVYQSKTFLSVPIELKDHLLGILNVSHKKGKEENHFTDLDLKILFMIVRQVRIAIENAKLYRQLKYLTMTDPLTGIYNYRYFAQTLDYEIARAKRYKRALSFLMIDIDQFKSYNDAFGHLEGDKLLKTVVRTIQQNVRQTDVVCRYAGDEFAVILPETDSNQAGTTAEKIRKAIAQMSAREPISVSIGVAQCTPNTDRYELIQRADSHLYKAKRQGKNQIAGENLKERHSYSSQSKGEDQNDDRQK